MEHEIQPDFTDVAKPRSVEEQAAVLKAHANWSQMGIDRALIVDYPWIDLLLSGEKTWEMRSRMTNIRGRIGLIPKGTGLVVGTMELRESLTARSFDEMVATRHLHCIPLELLQKLVKWRIPWVMENPIRFDEPISYNHPRGAVTWVRLR